MITRSFTEMLEYEMYAVMHSLLAMHEHRDEIIYIKGPALEQKYMELFGSAENQVIMEEIECELLQKKQQTIQIAINQRKPIDLEEINAVLDEERKSLLDAAVGTTPEPYIALTEEEQKELQRLYHEIVEHYHPQTHPDMTEHERELFALAREAYRRRNLEELQLIYTMLTDKLLLTDTEIERLRRMNKAFSGGDAIEINYADLSREDTDYGLASEIYSAFVPQSNEAALIERIAGYSRQIADIRAELEQRKQEFPYVAEETLQDSQKIEDYKAQLQVRLYNARSLRKKLEDSILCMMEGVR